MTDDADRTYQCPTCESENVDAIEYDDGSRVHIYCRNPDCGWTHRRLFADGSVVTGAGE